MIKNAIAIFPSILAILLLFLCPSLAFAEIKEIIAEGTYNMGDGETPTVAESRALLNAKRVAVEQAGIYIESYSKVKNIQLIEDEIKVLSSGVLEVTILDKKRTIIEEGFKFWVKIKARIVTERIEEIARKVKERTFVEDYKKLQRDYENDEREVDDLKKQLQGAKAGPEKIKVERKIADSEKSFQAKTWFEKGLKHALNKEYSDAIEAATHAIALDPNYTRSYALRGAAYTQKGQNDRAIEDCNIAIAKNPNDAEAYTFRGLAYWNKREYDKTIEDCNKAITLDPNLTFAYNNRGLGYRGKGEYDKAIEDYNRAIALDPNLKIAYQNRDLALKNISPRQRSCLFP